jgi:dTDP-4-amino-4,6-dideoxygalactose transaminase
VVFTKSKDLYQKARWYSDRGKPFGIEGAKSNVVCSLNLNLNDLSGCIGRVQLKKLPRIVAARRRVVKALAEKCRRLKSVRIVTGPKNCESSYWFLFVALDLSKLAVDKETFVKALTAEGVPAGVSYFHLFTRSDWYRNRAVFGKSGYPWTCPLYKGNPDQVYPTPNIEATDKCQFQLYIHESVGMKTVSESAAALKKVEEAYLR